VASEVVRLSSGVDPGAQDVDPSVAGVRDRDGLRSDAGTGYHELLVGDDEERW
jgi:hypothetical protein